MSDLETLLRLQQENHLLHAKIASLQAKAGRDAQVHLLLSRVAEQTAQIEAVRALCERRIEAVRPFMTPADLSAHDVLAVLNGGSDE